MSSEEPGPATPAPSDLAWTVLRDPRGDGAVNMARDHALALAVRPGRGVLRLYRWTRPTLSLGRNEPAAGCYDRELAGRLGVDVVRRPTGGRGVLHHRELTYAVVVPLRALGGARRAYHAINRGLRRGLASLGADADIAGESAPENGDHPSPGAVPRGSTEPLDAGPCFGGPAPGELVARGKKLVGSAQARLGDALLQHGSILLADDQGTVARLRGREPGSPPATLEELVGRAPPVQAVEAAVVRGLEEELGGRWSEPSTAEGAEAPEGLLELYRSEEWTWRR